ncbi:hypothetical protein [Arthrobacter sedimenti]|uniref:hypothetical protein n=1 Tax=Arthrobacter sedimenti TaxID=2694931 RepID=UPI0014218EF2|nr:hypothetical protein [Arthrobacter sedimenti]
MGRSAHPALLSSGALCLALILSSCASPEAGTATPEASEEAQPVTVTSSGEPTPSGQPSVQPSGEPSGEPTDPAADGDWATYTTSDGSLSFDHPAEWDVADAPKVPPEGVLVVVGDGTGRRLATLRTNLVTGAVCPEELPYALLDSEVLPALSQDSGTPRFVFEGRTDPSVADPVAASTLAYGITSAPEPTGPMACPIAHFFTWPPSGAAFGGTYDPHEIYPGKPQHIDTPEAYMETQEYQDIRAMITSLRPAG